MATFVVLGIAVPVFLYTLVMGLLGWNSSSSETTSLIFGSRSQSVFLYEAPATAAHFARTGGSYENLLGSWRNYFSDRKKPYQSVKDAAAIAKLKSGVLILPSAIALSDEERVAIKIFRDKGGSILATWATGTRNEKGDWVGWEFLEELGASDIKTMPASSEAKYLVTFGEAPVSHSHLAGQRIPMSKPTETLLKMKGQYVAGRFASGDRSQSPADANDAAVIYQEQLQKSRRSVIFAFGESAWETKPFATQVLIDDALKWLAHEVTAAKAAWPMGFRSAQVIEMDVENSLNNAQRFAQGLKAAGFPATFFITSAAANEHSKIVELLSKDFEIAYHSDVNAGLRGLDAASQHSRLSAMAGEIKEKLPNLRGIIGFKAPPEGTDLVTDAALKKIDIRYHAVDANRTDARLPTFALAPIPSDQEALLLLPRTQRNDQALLAGNASLEQLNQGLLDDLTESLFSGSLGWLAIRSNTFDQDSMLAQAFLQYLENTKQFKKRIWFANAAQVHYWWRDRERVKIDSSFDGKRLDFNITVLGESPVSGASFVIMLPRKDSRPKVQAIKAGVAVPRVIPIDDFRATIVFDQTNPGNYNYIISFDTN